MLIKKSEVVILGIVFVLIGTFSLFNGLFIRKDLEIQKIFDNYLYALNRIVEAKNIATRDIAETYRKMDTDNINQTSEEFKRSLTYSGVLMSGYTEINIKYQLAKNKLDTIKNLEMEDSIFDLTQALILYIEINNEAIKFYRHLQNTYLYNQKDNYQEGNDPNVNTAFYLLEGSFAKMDKIVFGDWGTNLDRKNTDDYQNFRDVILTID